MFPSDNITALNYFRFCQYQAVYHKDQVITVFVMFPVACNIK